jgi:hypothetical protein
MGRPACSERKSLLWRYSPREVVILMAELNGITRNVAQAKGSQPQRRGPDKTWPGLLAERAVQAKWLLACWPRKRKR